MVQKSLNLITWWKHEIFFSHDIWLQLFVWNQMYGPLSKMQVCLNDLQDYPANTNTNDVKKTCKKKKKQSKQNHGHWQYYKFLCISYISKYSNQVMLMY